MLFYAVKHGKAPGIFFNEEASKKQTLGVEGAKSAVFMSIEDAFNYISPNGHSLPHANLPQSECDSVLASGLGLLLSKDDAINVQPPKIKIKFSKDDMLTVYTDGCCFKNGKRGAVGGYGIFFEGYPDLNVSEPLSGNQHTNQRGELKAILETLKIAASDERLVKKRIHIMSDSEYSINVITKWMSSWKSKGWTKRGGGKVANVDIISELHSVMASSRERLGRGKITFEHVKGHSNDPGNDMADSLAKEGALKIVS